MSVIWGAKGDSRAWKRMPDTHFCVCLAVAMCSTPVDAQSWQTTDEVTHSGRHSVNLVVQKHEFSFHITCDDTAEKNGQLAMMFAGPALPRLYGTDGQEETLILSFDTPDKISYTEEWSVYYYDGGLGDQAWLGGLQVNKKMLDAFSGAQEFAILNMDMEQIYRFPAKGTAVGVARILNICWLGDK
jgi:hypothetical protein